MRSSEKEADGREAKRNGKEDHRTQSERVLRLDCLFTIFFLFCSFFSSILFSLPLFFCLIWLFRGFQFSAVLVLDSAWVRSTPNNEKKNANETMHEKWQKVNHEPSSSGNSGRDNSTKMMRHFCALPSGCEPWHDWGAKLLWLNNGSSEWI